MTSETETETAAPRRRASTPAAPKTAKYVVKGADIWTKTGRANVGTVVDLEPGDARHFVKAGKLDPYIPDEGLEESLD